MARDPGSAEDIRLEARRGARLGHPNIVGVLDSGTSARDFIVMELVDGVDVAQLLSRQDPLGAKEVVHLVVQICDALTHAHTRNVVHGNVTPGNILVRLPHLTAKLAHFGVASHTRSNADLYSLGRVAHEAIATPRPSLPRRLCEAVERACAREAPERQESVAEFRAPLTRPRDAAIVPFEAAA